MITLTRPLDEDLARSAAMHSRLCPRQVIGVRMARLACAYLRVDPAIERKQIFVFMECGRCAADAVIAVTGASPTNQLMKLIHYGKVAATFVNLKTQSAVRVSENQNSRDVAVRMMSPHISAWEAQLQAYQSMSESSLLSWQPVELRTPLPQILEKHCVVCETCGDRINEHSEVVIDQRILCKACAHGSYYQPLAASAGCLAAS
jgi:formylmethanofuran dehydrogenase subunit E